MTKPPRFAGSNFSKREIVLCVPVMILATALTVWGTFYVLKSFVLGNPSDPVTKAGGPSLLQERALIAK
jgi:hypothetical protein